MKTLVTGGSGFIGSNLVKALLEKGDEVVVIDNLSSGYKSNLLKLNKIEFIEGDIRDIALLEKIMLGVEMIYHLAASVGNKRSIADPFLDADINVKGTLCLLETARKFYVRKVIITSSAGIFGELKELPIKENHPIEPKSPYACSKLYTEKVSLAYADLYGIEAVCLRYFNVYGPNQYFDAYGNVIPIFVFKMLKNESIHIFGDGEQTRDFVNVRDVVQANIKSAMKTGISGAYNIASGTKISINHLVQLLKDITGLNPVIEYKKLRPGDVRDSLADISAAKITFDYLPAVDLRQGLEEYLQWAEGAM